MSASDNIVKLEENSTITTSKLLFQNLKIKCMRRYRGFLRIDINENIEEAFRRYIRDWNRFDVFNSKNSICPQVNEELERAIAGIRLNLNTLWEICSANPDLVSE